MTDRIIGPTGSKRRKRFLFVPILLVACTALFVVVGAQAVHDAGVFQLDGNAQVTVGSTPAMPTATEDADNICAAHLGSPNNNDPGPICHKAPNITLPGASTASESAFVTDAFGSATDNIYTTGGSKDDLDVTSWKFKTAQPSPDKADIENAFLGLYTATSGPNSGDKFAYFGGDRFSNGGDENTAFWLFQGPVSLNGNHAGDPTICDSGNGCAFTGAHTAAVPGPDNCLTPVGQTTGINISATKAANVPCTESDNGAGNPSTDQQGDILIVSAFTTGGTTSTISVYEWTGDHSVNPKSGLCVTSSCSAITKLSANPGCDANAAVTNDAACAITNQAVLYQSCPTGTPRPPCLPGNTIPTPSPWQFTEKSSDNSSTGASVTPNKWLDGIYFEAGVNLTALGLQKECTSSFLMNTRSSQSVDAALQDFALGQVGSCTSGTATTPKYFDPADSTYKDFPNEGIPIPAASTGSSTVKVRDHADINVTGGGGTFDGSVKFFLCGPLAANTTSNCESGGVEITPAASVSGSNGTASVNSADATLTSVGRYCWRAEYSGDPSKSVPPSRDPASGDTTSVTECFLITPIKPTLATAASCSPLTSGQCILGTGTLSDTATLTGTANKPGTNGIGPGGTINATNAQPANNSVSWILYGPGGNPAGCANTKATSPTSATVSGDSTYGPTSYKPVLADGVGTYTFVASYPGDSPNTSAADSTSCPDTTHTEEVTVVGTSSIASKQRWMPNDRVVVTGDANLNGTLTVTLYPTIDCTGTAVSGQTYTTTFANATSPQVFNTSNTDPASAGHTTFYVGTNPGGTAGGAAGSYSWLVHYADSNLTNPTDQCETSTVSPITDKP